MKRWWADSAAEWQRELELSNLIPFLRRLSFEGRILFSILHRNICVLVWIRDLHIYFQSLWYGTLEGPGCFATLFYRLMWYVERTEYFPFLSWCQIRWYSVFLKERGMLTICFAFEGLKLANIRSFFQISKSLSMKSFTIDSLSMPRTDPRILKLVFSSNQLSLRVILSPFAILHLAPLLIRSLALITLLQA